MGKISINYPQRPHFKVPKPVKFLLIGLLFFLACKSSFSDDLVIGVEELNYAPYYYHKEGRYTGFSRDLFDAYGAKYGHTIRFQALPIKRLYRAMLSGQVDLKFPDSPFWARDIKKDRKVLYSDEIVEYVDGVMVLSGRLGQSVEDLNSLSTVRGFTPWDFITQVNEGSIDVMEYNDLNGVISSVLHERVDGCYFNIFVANHYIKNEFQSASAISFDENLPHTKDYYQLSTIKHAKIIEEFNDFLIEERDFLEQLKKAYKIGMD